MTTFDKDIFSFERDYVGQYSGTFTAFVSKGYFIDIGIPKYYKELCKRLP